MRRIPALLVAVLLFGTPAPGPATAEPEVVPEWAIEKLATGFRFTEGPAIGPKGDIYFTDIPNQRIHRYAVKTGKTSVHAEESGRSNGLMFDTQGRLLACEGGRRRLVRFEDGKPTVLASTVDGKKLNSPNDLALDLSGGVYFTDPRYGSQKDRELDFEGVYYVAKDGSLKRVATEIEKPNGILMSADAKTLYVADSKRKRIMAFDVAKPGEVGKARLFANLDLTSRGGPDGMSRDKGGNVYCAGQGKVWIWDPKGKVVATIKMPEGPSNCLWTAESGWTVYVTARTSFYRVRKAVATER